MTTVVNNPSGESSGSGMGFMVGMIVLAVLAVLFFVYGLPALRQSASSGGVQIEVPDQIDVNVNPDQVQGQ